MRAKLVITDPAALEQARDEDTFGGDLPVKILRYRRDPHTETRVFARERHESFCIKKGCQFFGKRASQGTCHTRLDGKERGLTRDAEVERAARYAEERIQGDYHCFKLNQRNAGKKATSKAYIEHLKGIVYCHYMNEVFQMSELIWHRAESARLKNRLGIKVKVTT